MGCSEFASRMFCMSIAESLSLPVHFIVLKAKTRPTFSRFLNKFPGGDDRAPGVASFKKA